MYEYETKRINLNHMAKSHTRNEREDTERIKNRDET